MFLLVQARPGSPGQRAMKWLLFIYVLVGWLFGWLVGLGPKFPDKLPSIGKHVTSKQLNISTND